MTVMTPATQNLEYEKTPLIDEAEITKAEPQDELEEGIRISSIA